VHPPVGGASKFGSLWPFEGLGFGSKEKGKEEGGPASPSAAAGEKMADGTTDKEGHEVVVGEDGSPVSRVVEAKRRTSLEDPDEDEEVIV